MWQKKKKDCLLDIFWCFFLGFFFFFTPQQCRYTRFTEWATVWYIYSCSDDSSLIMVGVLMEDEGHSFVPWGLEHCVVQSSFICTVMPAWQVAGAVWIIGRSTNLTAVYTALTSKPWQRKTILFARNSAKELPLTFWDVFLVFISILKRPRLPVL